MPQFSFVNISSNETFLETDAINSSDAFLAFYNYFQNNNLNNFSDFIIQENNQNPNIDYTSFADILTQFNIIMTQHNQINNNILNSKLIKLINNTIDANLNKGIKQGFSLAKSSRSKS